MLIGRWGAGRVSDLFSRMPLLAVAIAVALALTACGPVAADEPFVDLTNREAVPAAAPTGATSSST